MSHKLKVAEARAEYITEQDVWSHFNFIFSEKSKNSASYKYALVKSLLENLYSVNEKLELTYYQVFESFTEIYWNLVIHHKLSQLNLQQKSARIETVLKESLLKHHLNDQIIFEKIPDQIKIKIVKKVITECKNDVMGALYGDTQGLIYSFDNYKRQLKLTPSFYSFMQRFQKVLMYLSNYHLALFLEKYNSGSSTDGLLLKIENVSKRKSLDKFYLLLASVYQKECFYCGNKIKSRKGNHVDHFIPWSFIQNDQLWNLVIACVKCNTSKNNKLADKEFLEKLIQRNNFLSLEENITQRVDMQLYVPKKLEDLYKYSRQNGYTDIWTPNRL
ncbi:HNH endonuclease [Jeotgalibacillus haloalkalitolerans]|uniref:HNH endonuclease domain-containing protein n=1 Tax=Jeotgalibacillus haloalkalitolerans TaxID=3104292 RepID=A0ABU5KJS0_9BACL|nr:HNH endonuclease domain-containing protein [Jeotgalibacillus sp. HH7-29]MDZ5711001.1 HNH endonuclease domain-containing protein [Jeotgalibacillus sp. HH7-29]